jgi:hypothetical protein
VEAKSNVRVCEDFSVEKLKNQVRGSQDNWVRFVILTQSSDDTKKARAAPGEKIYYGLPINLFALFHPLTLAEADTCATAILVDEFDAGGF